MKTKAISSIFLLFTIAIGIISITPGAFADHHEITITPISGSSLDSGCEKTQEGCYNPSPVTVYVGSVIVFSNTDNVSHTFSSGVPSDDIIGTEFNTGILAPGDSGEWIHKNFSRILKKTNLVFSKLDDLDDSKCWNAKIHSNV